MCMNNPLKIRSENVPKYGYKVYNASVLYSDTDSVLTGNKTLKTYFRKRTHFINEFNKSESNKQSHKSITYLNSRLHYGRLSVYLNKKDAVDFCKHTTNGISQVWKVEIKQTTKYAYMGKFCGTSFAVDQVKPLKRVF